MTESLFPTIEKHIAERIRAKCQDDEVQMRRAAFPLLAQGYRVEELEAVYGMYTYRLLGVNIKTRQPKSVLALRRFWRFLFRYEVGNG